MIGYEFQLDKPVKYNWTGKFVSPSPEWMHMSRYLSDYELMVMTEGELYIGDDKGEYVIKKGEMFLDIPPTHQFGYKASNCSFYWLHFSYNEYKNDAKLVDTSDHTFQANEHNIVLPVHAALPSPDRVVVLMKQLQDSERKYREPNLSSYLTTTILYEIHNQFSAKTQSNDKGNAQTQLYYDIKDYINWHICENIKISEIANYFGYNEKYLSALFHKLSDYSIKQYIIQEKMELAKGQLTDTNHPVSQIAYNIGFNDTHHFTNSFKKFVGLTPTEYRNSYSQRMLFYQ